MKKNTFYWLFQIVGWGFFGIIQVFLFSADGQSVDRMHLLVEGLQVAFNIFITHGFRYFVIKFKWLNFRMAKLIPLVLVSVVVLSLLSSIFLTLIILIRNASLSFETLLQPIVIQTTESVFLFLFWSLAYFIYLYFERYNTSLKYEATIRETELNNLKFQLNPHFIFNALNSIRALVDENPQKSKKAITQLSHILRNSLNSDRKKLVPFSEELRTVKDYLGLESIRYEERLRVRYKITEGSEQFQMPPLMLQTLVENGVKHGIANLKKGGEVTISTYLKADQLVVQVRNTGQLDEEKKLEAGFGLSNTKKRLEMIYGKEARFKIKNEDPKTVLTEIKLPK